MIKTIMTKVLLIISTNLSELDYKIDYKILLDFIFF